MKQFIFILMILASCNNAKTKTTNAQADIHLSSNEKSFYKDTSILGMRISQQEYDKLEKLKMKDRNAYAEIILKQFAFCNCMYQSFRNDSTFMAEDASNAFLATELVIHKHDVIDSIRQIVKEYLLPSRTIIDSENHYKNQSYNCLKLYKSDYLDSVIKQYDKKIIPEDY